MGGRPPTLDRGDSGRYVTYVQEFLGGQFAGSMTVPPDVTGHFDDATATAVEAFQTMYGLSVDGEVGPETWGVIMDMDPTTAEWGHDLDVGDEVLEMPPMLVGYIEQPEAGTIADPTRELNTRGNLNQAHSERERDPEVRALIPIVDSRFEQLTGGYPLTAYVYDPSLGYEAEALTAWFDQLAAVKEEVCEHLAQVAALVRHWAAEERSNPREGFDGFMWSIAEFLGEAVEPRSLWFVERAEEHLDQFAADVTAGKPRSAAYSLAAAMDVQSLYFQAWKQYHANAVFGLEVVEFVREATEEIAEEILIAAATGGIGRWVTKVGGLTVGTVTKAAGSAVLAGKAEVVFSAAEALSYVLQGSGERFDFTAEMKGALLDAAVEFGTGLFGEALGESNITDEVEGAMKAAAKSTSDRMALELMQGSDYVVTELPKELVAAAIETVADKLVGMSFDDASGLAGALVRAFLMEHGEQVFSAALEDVREHVFALDRARGAAEVEAARRRLEDALSVRIRYQLQSISGAAP